MSGAAIYGWARAARIVHPEASLVEILSLLFSMGMARDQRRHAYHGWIAGGAS